MNTISTSGQEFLALVKKSLAANTSLPPPFRSGNQLAFKIIPEQTLLLEVSPFKSGSGFLC
jgi:hypothetical protein